MASWPVPKQLSRADDSLLSQRGTADYLAIEVSIHHPAEGSGIDCQEPQPSLYAYEQ